MNKETYITINRLILNIKRETSIINNILKEKGRNP
jgi:hypothetical protein